MFRVSPERIVAAAAELTEGIRAQLQSTDLPASRIPAARLIEAVVRHFEVAFDPAHGGLRSAPKFPSSLPLRLLMRHHVRTGEPKSREMVERTLEKMAGGGIYDHLAGGFHRYSTDRLWRVPHFEKMLYDNAQLSVTYAEAYQLTGRADFARVLEETLAYLIREMTSPEGGLYSATDADSEGEEGRFFVWEEGEVKRLLGPRAERFIRYYGIAPGGDLDGRTVLHTDHPDEAEWRALAPDRATLLAARLQREPPLLDDKILAAWNGLAISAFAWGGRVLRADRHLEAGRRAASFVLEKLRVEGKLRRSTRKGQVAPQGFLDDYAFVVQGLVDLFEATFELRWLDEALALSRDVESRFADPRGGWFLTAHDHEALLAREKPNQDGAEPSGTSVHTLNLLRLAALTEDRNWTEIADRAVQCFAPILVERPLALTEMFLAVDFAAARPRQIILAMPEGEAIPPAFADAVAREFLPSRVIAGAQGAAGLVALASRVPLAAEKVVVLGKATAYVCDQGACQLPTTDGETLRRQLAASRRMGAVALPGVDKGGPPE
jgi:uncharacterized protein YyaL (SSP411 family)